MLAEAQPRVVTLTCYFTEPHPAFHDEIARGIPRLRGGQWLSALRSMIQRGSLSSCRGLRAKVCAGDSYKRLPHIAGWLKLIVRRLCASPDGARRAHAGVAGTGDINGGSGRHTSRCVGAQGNQPLRYGMQAEAQRRSVLSSFMESTIDRSTLEPTDRMFHARVRKGRP